VCEAFDVKRLFDILASLVGLIVLGPIMLVLAVLVKLDSPGPVLYRAPRIGRRGHPFHMFKFRTMVADADRMGPAVTYDRDPRITRLGAILRGARLDEWPQLINVLRGEMSLVGPRPEAPDYVAYYTPEQRAVLRVRPGVTGLAQLTFRHEEEMLSHDSPEEDYVKVILPHKVSIDLNYIERQSLWLDARILVSTVVVMVGDRLGLPTGAGSLAADVTSTR
jgi:lipopolysaccharide/colanic/teichoic acid biosynthesis glycosyltransferase